MFEKWSYWSVTIKWRKFLICQAMDRYFVNDNFYHIQKQPEIDNPALRITDDVSDFVEATLAVIDKTWSAVLHMVSYFILLVTMDWVLAVTLVPYAVISGLIILWIFGSRLSKAKEKRVKAVASFRSNILQVGEYAESIAFCKGNKHEHHWAILRLHRYLKSMWDMESIDRYVETSYRFMEKLCDGLPYFIVAHRFFQKESSMTMGDLASAAKAGFEIMESAMVLVDNLRRIADLTAAARRILELHAAFDEQEEERFETTKEKTPVATGEDSGSDSPDAGSPSAELILRDVCISTPLSFNKLVQDLNLTVAPGTSVLIVGHSGVGKSSLLRAICGLWEVDRGTIQLPQTNKPMFLPQNVYIPDIPVKSNTLRSQILFPNTVNPTVEDADIEAVLERVNLGKLLGKKGVQTTDDWRSRLSGGEKQRLAMARILLTRPSLAFLDEATSALDAENERRLYHELQSRGATYISVGHKEELRKYHSHVLELQPEGKWKFYDSIEFQPLTKEE